MAGRALAIPKKSKTESLPLEEQIRQRAHAIYLERGGQDGAEMDDWLQAEQEILGQQESETSQDGAEMDNWLQAEQEILGQQEPEDLSRRS